MLPYELVRLSYPRDLNLSLGQTIPTPPAGLSPEVVKGVTVGAQSIKLGFFALGSYVGIWTGMKGKGINSVAGWGFGVVSGLAGIGALIELVKVSVAGTPENPKASTTQGPPPPQGPPPR